MEAEEDALVGMEATLSGPVGLRMTQCFGGVNAVRADPRRELVWVGTSAGDVTTLHAETLQPYSCWNPERANAPEKKQSLPLHLQTTQAILDLAPVGQESLVASCTKDLLTLNDVGGFTRFARKTEDLKRNKHQALQSSGTKRHRRIHARGSEFDSRSKHNMGSVSAPHPPTPSRPAGQPQLTRALPLFFRASSCSL